MRRTAVSMTSRFCAYALIASSFAVGACQEEQVQDIPNRVLDRPSDLALTCVRVVCPEDADACHMEAGPIRNCAEQNNNCLDYDPNGSGVDGDPKKDGTFHLVGFVANSERNELAMFTKCSGRLVDMDKEAPGYNFISVGELPTDLAATADGCRVISSNRGSCTLGVLDAEGAAGYGFGLPASGGGSALVEDVVPLRYDGESERWLPLGAWPGEIVPVPTYLSHAIEIEAPQVDVLGCDSRKPGSAYVTFPSCGIVAEIDLLSGHVLASLEFVQDPDSGLVSVVDRGTSPSCAVDCPAQFKGGTVPDIASDASTGVRPQALALITTGDNTHLYEVGEASQSEEAIVDNTLYVGGLGSDRLFEIPMGRDIEGGLWDASKVTSLDLPKASGIATIRSSPVVRVNGGSEAHQFLYVISGDGATRVVRREFDFNRTSLGRECDTQIDPIIAATEDIYCPSIPDNPSGAAPLERRGFAEGPGIRAPAGAKFTDWVFQRFPAGQPGEGGEGGSIAGVQGTVAIGTTNFGALVFSVIDGGPFQGREPESLTQDDPTDLFEATLRPHNLFPEVLPNINEISWRPLVRDEAVRANISGLDERAQHLVPTIRLIDLAYKRDEYASAALGVYKSTDKMGAQSSSDDAVGAVGYYTNNVARVAVRDYRSWGSSEWRLEWEGAIPGTESSSGQLVCDQDDLGWADASCLATDVHSSRLLRRGASFCDAGVLPGDKLVLLGCSTDEQCGVGQRCLRESAAGGDSSGICVSEQAYAQDAEYLREVCGEFISDPCGEAFREYRVTRAFQDELWLQALDLPPISFVDEYAECESGTFNRVIDDDDGGGCACLPDFEPCSNDEDPAGPNCCPKYGGDGVQAPGEDEQEGEQYARLYEREGQFICAEEQVEGGCTSHSDCQELESDDDLYCVEGMCRRECSGSDECTLRRLPGPACFSEFVRYRVAADNSFVFRGGGAASFMTDLVQTIDHGESLDIGNDALDRDGNPTLSLDSQRYECVERPSDSNVSELMTSRIRLPANSEGLASIPVCGSDIPHAGESNPCRISATRTADDASKFHRLAYNEAAIPALRFSNPVMSIVLDLTDPMYLSQPADPSSEGFWPTQFRLFRRSRIPRGYRQSFSTRAGYIPKNSGVRLGGSDLTFPTRIVNAPEYGIVYVVDSSGPGSGTSIRGQVMRVQLLGNVIVPDENFDGVR